MLDIIVPIGIGILIVILGLLIWKKKMLFLLAGYREDLFYGDKSKFAKRMGIIVILLGIVSITMPFSILIFGSYAVPVYQFLIVFLVVIAIVAGNYWRFRL